ncbi:MAG: GGDEF domain-containing protein [Myxococcales bacterium]|nr:GGDEF domain-containing protein [Myxococcales bacterium]
MARGLPPEVERAARLSAVPPHLRSTFALLPAPLEVRVRMPEGASLPPAANQLIKLALLGAGATLVSVEPSDYLEVEVALRDKRRLLRPAELRGDLPTLLPTLLLALFAPTDVANLLDRLATQSSRLATLRLVTGHMLGTRDLSEAHRLLLVGLTSGFGLGFHRAGLFLYDVKRGVYVGVRAVGPADETAAHRIWEALELEDAPLDRILAPASDEMDLERLFLRIELDPEEEPARTALAAKSLVLFDRQPPSGRRPASVGLGPIDPGSPFLLAALRARDETLGLVFADDRFRDGPIASERLAHTELFLDQAAVVLENLSLLDRVSRLARTDPLTGLLNRRELEARFDVERSRSERDKAALSMLVVDVDLLKRTNDSKGHQAGDALLQDVATLLSKSFRAHDAVARFGGDEFVVLLPGSDPEALRAAAQRVGDEAFRAGVSLSLGGASWPVDTAALDELFATADAALYKAKQSGRACAFIGRERIDFGAT